jgi:hypothetical protein
MATTVAQLQARLDADTSPFDRAMRRSDSVFSKIGRNIGRVALAAGAAVATGLGITAKIGFDEFSQHAKVVAQTNAALKSTGRVAGVTAKDIDNLANSLMSVSGIDDELIAQSENLLLTFRSVRNEVGKGNQIFDRATKAILDVSVAFHKDLNQSTVMVGKALQDPIRGLTALRRVGIQFTDQQEDMIKKMVEAGDTMGAQKLILHELEVQAGGSAEALGDTLPGQINILKESFRDMAGQLVGGAMPALMSLSQWVVEHMPQIREVFGTVFHFIGRVVRGAVRVVQEHWPQISAVFAGVRDFVVNSFLPAFQDMRKEVTSIVRRVAAVFVAHKADLTDIWDSVKSTVSSLMKIFREAVLPLLKKTLPVAIDIAIPIIRDLARALAAVANAAYTIVSAVKSAIEWLNKLPGSSGGKGGGPIDWLHGLTSQLEHLPGGNKQHGGPVSARRSYIVGEAGPELFVPRMSGTIIPNNRLAAAGGGGGTVVFNFPNYVGSHSELERAMQRVVREYEMRNGRPPF